MLLDAICQVRSQLPASPGEDCEATVAAKSLMGNGMVKKKQPEFLSVARG